MPLPKEIIDAVLSSSYGEKAYKLVEQLQDAGYDTWWVGGGVRDMTMGQLPKDIDIGTEATPEQIKAVFPKATQDPNALGSMRVPMGKTIFEVTTFREDDSASDGRHPEAVVFSTREKDAHRRDFTINTLYFHPISRELYDPFNGERDVKERLIRFIGDPVTRIRHDALRMMRAVRFRALIDGQYDPATYQALHEQTSMLEALSHTRKFEELQKMLLTPKPDRALEDLWELDMLQHFLPELHSCKGTPQPREYHKEGDVWDHLMACIRSFLPEHGIDVRLAALLHDIGKVDTYDLKDRVRSDGHASASADAAENVLSRLQCPVKRREKIVWLIRHHMMMATLVDDTLPEDRASHWYHHPWFQELLQLFWLDIMGTTPHRFGMYDDILKRYHHFLDTHPRPPKPLLNGQEVMDILGLKPGEKVGEILKALYAAQIKGVVHTKKDAKEFLKKLG